MQQHREAQEARVPCYCRHRSLPLLSLTLNFIFFIITLVLTINESIQKSSQVFSSCYLGRFITHEVVFFYAIAFSITWLLHIFKIRRHQKDQLTQKILKFMIGPLLLTLSIIAIKFWGKIVHKCSFERDRFGNIESYRNVKSNVAILEATVILFSFLISVVMSVVMFIKKVKERDRRQISLFNSIVSFYEAKFESLSQIFRTGDNSELDMMMPRHLSLSQALITRR